ncbi:MAG: amidohydrolase family protein, partial [Anaerolineae bacterium]|nr:amidohydrolase family protein [Anaerolineae bacterium]
PDDLPRLRQHGLVASMQPIHLATDWFTADRVWGKRARYAYAFRTLLDHGTSLALGSDAPVAPLNPFHGIQAAVTRQDLEGRPAKGWYPEEKISLAEAIAGYTVGPARLAGKEAVQGSISPGKWADLIVLEQNIFDIAASDIAQTAVKATIFDGQIVFQ